MLKKFFKPIIASVMALVVAFSVVPTVSAASIYSIDLDTGNPRTNRGLKDEKQKIVDFHVAYTQFKNSFPIIGDSLPSQAVLKESAAGVEEANQKLQAESFTLPYAPLYEPAGVEVKSTAQALTDLVVRASNDGVTNDTVDAIRAELNAAYDKFFTALEKLDTAAGAYDPPGAWLAFVLIGGVIALFVLMIVILVRRSNKKTAERIFGNDPAALQLTPEQKKLVVRLANDVNSYEKALGEGNNSLINALEVGTYTPNKEKGADPALGKYAFIIEEFGALVQLNARNTEVATEAAQRAARIKGDSALLTVKARQLVTSNSEQN